MYLAKIIKSKEHTYLYDALNNKFAVLESEQDILDDEKYVEFLANTGFRDVKKPCEFEIKYPYSREELEHMHNGKIKSMTLALTEQCNLRCKYCGYMSKYMDDEYELKDMPKEVAFKAIDILMNQSDESEICHLGFYGGEPLLKLDLIKECIDYINQTYPFRKVYMNMVTNAVLLTDEVTDFIIENDMKLNISLDGPCMHHNKYRVNANGDMMYDKIIKNVKAFYEKDPVYFRENVTYNVVMYNGANDELLSALDSMWKSEINLIDLLSTEYFEQVRDESDKLIQNEKVDIRKYDFAYKGLLKEMKKYYNSLGTPAYGNAVLPGGFCVPGIRKNFVTTDGDIVVCEKVDETKDIFHIGDVYNGVDIEKVEKLLEKTMQSLSRCKHCWGAKLCKICFMQILNVGDDFCMRSRKEVEAELGYYLDNINNNKELVNYVANISLI